MHQKKHENQLDNVTFQHFGINLQNHVVFVAQWNIVAQSPLPALIADAALKRAVDVFELTNGGKFHA